MSVGEEAWESENEQVSPQSKRWLLAGFALMLAMRACGTAFSPALLAYAPAGLIALSPFVPHLIITAPLLPAALFFPLAILVSLAQSWLGYLFGRSFGPWAIQWLSEHTPANQERLEQLLGLVERAAPVVLLALPGPMLATIAGVARVSPRRMFLLMIVAQLFWVSAAYLLGASLAQWIEAIQAFALSYALPLTLVFCAAVATWHALTRARKRRDKDITQ